MAAGHVARTKKMPLLTLAFCGLTVAPGKPPGRADLSVVVAGVARRWPISSRDSTVTVASTCRAS